MVFATMYFCRVDNAHLPYEANQPDANEVYNQYIFFVRWQKIYEIFLRNTFFCGFKPLAKQIFTPVMHTILGPI